MVPCVTAWLRVDYCMERSGNCVNNGDQYPQVFIFRYGYRVARLFSWTMFPLLYLLLVGFASGVLYYIAQFPINIPTVVILVAVGSAFIERMRSGYNQELSEFQLHEQGPDRVEK